MSNSHGALKHGNDIYYLEYAGTVDVFYPNIYKTIDEVEANWRKQPSKYCTCNQPPVDVEVATTYGRGFYWPAKACLNCMVLVDHLEPDYDNERGGLPEWYPNKAEYERYYR